MAIPVYLQQFKAAGIYRIVFDKSTIAGVDSSVLRLVVGYSEKGPFNIPVYISSPSDFKAVYGDISKKLEKRGVFFHRIALNALAAGPILALNLKKFDGETVDGATISTDFNPNYDIINTVKLNVEDIYDTTRFWELSAEKLNGLKSATGAFMDQYINICAINTKEMSGSYFIRKASGSKLNGYNITVSDWYSDKQEEMPEYLEPFANSLISDFFAEIYVFKGRFTKAQVLASSTLKHYFEGVDDPTSNDVKLRKYVTNAYGDAVDALDALYNDETSGAIGHYVGALIPYFKNKQGQYAALDVLFNNDTDAHNMMMSFNIDMLEEDGHANIDLSGRLSISNALLADLYNGTAKTSLLGNLDSEVVSEVVKFTNNVVKKDGDAVEAIIPFDNSSDKKVTGTLYVKGIDDENFAITLNQIGTDDSVTITCSDAAEFWSMLDKLGAKAADADVPLEDGYGTVFTEGHAFIDETGAFTLEGPAKVITSITRIEATSAQDPYLIYGDADKNMKVSIVDVAFATEVVGDEKVSVYGSSITFMPVDETAWTGVLENGVFQLKNTDAPWDRSIFSTVSVGDCFLAADGTVDRDNDGEKDAKDGFYDNVYVQAVEAIDNGDNTFNYVIKFTGEPMIYAPTVGADTSYLVRIDGGLNQEVGTMVPQYLEGYVYKNAKPASTSMLDKLNWQASIMSAITDYKGLKTALLNKANIDYRYIVDSFDSYIDESLKKVLSFLAKEKQNALAILNFPSVKTFLKCPYTSFTDAKGIFNVQYVVDGYNKKKAAGKKFSLPTEAEGASFAAFYTPLKFSDGYVDTIVPSAGLVSNLFIEKYASRQPYYIVAGPNFAKITAAGLVGPDYTYSMDELQVIEPFGVNCMVYRPGFGTFINANQTAKQTPVSALSKVNIRELVIYLQDEIEKVLQAYQWEFNNATTRTAILDKADYICARIAANGGIQAFKNVMDESNNTPEIIDNEMAILSTHIEPGKGCGKMIHELTLYKTGQMASNIIE
ncbi:MAG: hypothetical protein IKN46_04675 [Acholeplasmatales bacterium]|nr:hypothetical protein [Acholeplasmatales bacterium]